MGYFSFKTQDTDKSICNKDSQQATFKVIMTDDKGNQYTEKDYKGYGEFGGKYFYELLAEMNGKKTRDEGIGLVFFKEDYISPSLSEDGAYYNGEAPKICEFQGCLYDVK